MSKEDQIYRIPAQVVTYKEGEADKMVIDHDIKEDGLVYDVREGERVIVTLWVQYPSYDFIFGVPAPDSPKYEHEVGYFQFRDTRANKIKQGIYLDCEEIDEMIQGFSLIREKGFKLNSALWTKHLKNK